MLLGGVGGAPRWGGRGGSSSPVPSDDGSSVQVLTFGCGLRFYVATALISLGSGRYAPHFWSRNGLEGVRPSLVAFENSRDSRDLTSIWPPQALKAILLARVLGDDIGGSWGMRAMHPSEWGWRGVERGCWSLGAPGDL